MLKLVTGQLNLMNGMWHSSYGIKKHVIQIHKNNFLFIFFIYKTAGRR